MSAFRKNLHITNDTKNLRVVREFLGEAIVVSGRVPADWQNKITLAVDEAISNIIEHAYEAGQQGEIDVAIIITPEKFEVVINDAGREFEPEEIGEVDIASHVSTRQKSGLGIFIMRRIMDEVKYTFKEGEKNELRMIKYFARP